MQNSKENWLSQEPDTRVKDVPRAGETRDDGKRKEDQITSPTEPLTPTHWGQKNHTGFIKFQSQYFLVPEMVVFYIVLFFFVSSSVALWPFWKFQAPLVFGRPTKSILFDFSTQKSLNKNILGRKCYSHKQSPLREHSAIIWLHCIELFLFLMIKHFLPQYISVSFSPSRVGVDIWAVRILGSCWLCVYLCMCVLW